MNNTLGQIYFLADIYLSKDLSHLWLKNIKCFKHWIIEKKKIKPFCVFAYKTISSKFSASAFF